MEPIKVVRIITRLNVGGPAIHSVLLTAGLDRARFRTRLAAGCVGPDEADMSYYADALGVTYEYIPQLRRELSFLNDTAAFFRIWRLLKKERPRILHTHTAKAGTLGRCAGILLNLFSGKGAKRMALVHTFHGHVLTGYFNAPQKTLFAAVERLLARFTDRIVTVSASVKDDLVSLRIAAPEKISVIPLGFDLDRFLAVPVPADSAGPLRVGIIGRLAPIKNHLLFLRVAARFLKERPAADARFFIIGDGALRASLEALADSLGIRSRVTFTGWRRDLQDVYAGLDVIMLTSDNEGTPVSLIEAMACARPVISSEVGGTRDLTGADPRLSKQGFKVMERGILVRAGDEAGFAAGLAFLADDYNERRRLALSGREFVKSFHCRQRLIRDIEGLYQELSGCSSAADAAGGCGIISP